MKSSSPLPEPQPEPQSETTAAPSATLTLDQAFDQELATVETALRDLQTRHSQVQQAQQSQTQLLEQREQVQQALQQGVTPELQSELQQIDEKLADLSYTLESQLLNWASAQKPFWQILRFVGLGLVLGWGLAFWVLRSPQPESPVLPPPTEYQGK